MARKGERSQLPIVDGRRGDTVSAKSSAGEKVRLFRSLFRGRADVFPKLWVNERKGKKGYAPACSNEWVRSLCDKPRVRCGSCPNQAFVPVTDRVILDHLQGRHVVGVYPLLQDDTCWFLAIDFDKGSWADDVSAFRTTCRGLSIPVLVERSRSGRGAHAWLFFAAPIAAVTARSLGSYLLTETMNEHDALDMSSYDRMFPNQDTMPRGGFGNLIALPLQHAARASGNTEFVNDQLEPLEDQWAALHEYPRLPPDHVEDLVETATKRGTVLGLPAPPDDDESQPWERPPTRRETTRIVSPVPKSVRAVLRQQLFIEKRDLPPSLITALKRLAAFQNPEFYKRQQLRLSVARTPRVIACGENHPNHVSIPRGCVEATRALLADLGSELVIEDKRQVGEPLSVSFDGTLSDTQQSAVEALLPYDTGVLVAPPGIGKTVIGTSMVATRGIATLVLVHRSQLLEQWVNQLSAFLGVPPRAIGRLGAGRRSLNGKLDVAMFQSLVKRDQVDDAIATYGHVIVDECHHVSSVTFERALRAVRARYVLGLTATPKRRDGHHPITEMQLGPIRFALTDKQVARARRFSCRVVARRTNAPIPTHDQGSVQSVYEHLAADKERNDLIVRDVVAALEMARSPLVLTERRDHLDVLEQRLSEHTANVIVLHGGLSKRERAAAMDKLRSFDDDEERVVLATGRFAGEGFDDPQLDTLFLALLPDVNYMHPSTTITSPQLSLTPWSISSASW